jgi:hypothetical protein
MATSSKSTASKLIALKKTISPAQFRAFEMYYDAEVARMPCATCARSGAATSRRT